MLTEKHMGHYAEH
jgi:hypothetical protein